MSGRACKRNLRRVGGGREAAGESVVGRPGCRSPRGTGGWETERNRVPELIAGLRAQWAGDQKEENPAP